MRLRYVEWLLNQGTALYEADGQYWQNYQGALIPANPQPVFLKLDAEQTSYLLKKSGALFLRYTAEQADCPTDWWYIVCDEYDFDKLPNNVRRKINRGCRQCTARQITPEWLAENGYECYSAAFDRYRGAVADSETVFRKKIISTIEGPFEYWGVFCGNALAGFAQCIVEDGYVNTSVSKYHPEYLKNYAAYTLTDTMSRHYVYEQKMTICNGTRSIYHITNYQDYLKQFGYRKQFARLRIAYRPYFYFFVQAILPMHKVLDYLPKRGAIQKVRALLMQERIRRRCMS